MNRVDPFGDRAAASLFILPLLLMAFVSCKPGGGAGQVRDAASPRATPAPPVDAGHDLLMERGQAIVTEAFAVLSSNLMSAMAAGGPSNAISFCSVEALPLTAGVGKGHAVEIRRVAHKVRNPRNAPTPEEAAVLRLFQDRLAAGEPASPLVQHDADGAIFYAPIMLNNTLCLLCHGEPGREVGTETLALLNTLYPDDQATGFKLHDLRGAWVVLLAPVPGSRR